MNKEIIFYFIAFLTILIPGCNDRSGSEPGVPFFTNGIIHTVGANPAIKTTKTGEGNWDDWLVESGDCFKDGDTYYWYYHAVSEWDSAGYQIGVATAQDPLGPWIRHEENPIVKVSLQISHESSIVACPMVVKENDRYCMIYLSAGEGPDGWVKSVSLAYADNPLGPWVKYEKNPILMHPHMGYPGGLVHFENKWYMYGTEPGEVQRDFGRMYVATADSIEGPWEVREEPALSEGPKGSWEEGAFSEFEVQYYNGLFHAFYGGSKFAEVSDTASLEELKKARGRVKEGIGYAYSEDGIHFTKYKGNPVVPYQNVPNCAAMAEVHFIIEYPRIYCYHTLRYLECPEGENQQWFDDDMIEHMGIQVLVDIFQNKS